MNYDRLLTQLSKLLEAPDEQQLFAVFSDIVGEAGGTAFDVVGSHGVGSVRGLIGWCEGHAPDGQLEERAGEGRPLFWGSARVAGVHATGQFRLGDTGGFALIDALLAPVPTEGGLARPLLLRIGTMDLDEDIAHLLGVLSLACTRRLSQLRVRVQEGQPLSRREQQVLHWLAEGKSAEDVADILHISPATVMFHYRGVATRYGTLNRTHTVVEAMRRGALKLG